MRISKINEQPHSDTLVEKLKEERKAVLIEGMMLSSESPYSYGSSGDKLTLLFEKDDADKKGVVLPLQTNVRIVKNLTNYKSQPSWNGFKNLFIGKLEYVRPEKLEEFLQYLKKCDVRDLSLYQCNTTSQSPNQETGAASWSAKGADTYRPTGSTLQEKADDVKEKFVSYPEGVLIDPASDVRIEKRTKKDGTELYQAILVVNIHTGLSGEPPLNNKLYQAIKAAVKQ